MSLRLAFMGTADFAVPSLAALIAAGHDIAAVYSQPARPKGRGHKPLPSPVAALALDKSIELRTPERLDPDAIAAFVALDLDVAVVAAYGLILPQAVLDAPRRGCVNVHASLLPRWRGAAPIERAILAGDAETGVTIMRMAAGLDTGPDPAGRAGRRSARAPPRRDLHDELAQARRGAVVRTLGAKPAAAQAARDWRDLCEKAAPRGRRASTGAAPLSRSTASFARSTRASRPGSRMTANASS